MSNKDENIPEDQLLVREVLNGNKNAFLTIIRNTEGLVAQIVFKMIQVREDRKDISQDIYLKVYQNLPGFRFQSKLSTWVGQIAYNTCINFLEKKKFVLPDYVSDGVRDNEEVLEMMGSTNTGSGNETDRIIIQKELASILETEINNLSSIYKTMITLYHTEELSYSEIAQITALPEGTVKNYLFRARKTLKDNLLRSYKKESL